MVDLADTIITWARNNPFPWLAIVVLFAALTLAVSSALIFRLAARLSRKERQSGDQESALNAMLAELKGRISQMSEMTAQRQEELSRSVNERLDRMGLNVGVSIEETGRRTALDLAKLNERLALIDSAQRNMMELSGRILSLKDILANKQARGAFGQIRMEAIVADALPKGAYSFQPTLSNGKRPDCIIQVPGTEAGIVIDAKFPLESFEALRKAASEDARLEAQSRIRRDVAKHIDDIAAKYFLPRETQDLAMLFVPAESVYAELHDGFPDLIQKAYRARVVIVSPNMLMLAVQTLLAVLKDARMGEQASVIRREAGLLLEDMTRLRNDVLEFQRRFLRLGSDLEKIMSSAGTVAARARRLEGGGEKDDDSASSSIVAAE